MADAGNSRDPAPRRPVPITDPRRARLLRHMGYTQAQAQAQTQVQAQIRAKAETIQRGFARLKMPYEQALIKRPRLAELLMARHLAVEQAIGLGLWQDAEQALAAFETALRTPPSGEDALLYPGMSNVPKQVATGTPISAEPKLLSTEEQRAADLKDQQKLQAQVAEVQLKLRRLKLPYDQALIKRPQLAAMLKSRYEAVQKAIAEGSWAATDALAKLDAALKTPPSGEAALLDEWMPKAAKTSVAGTPLTAEPTLLGTAEQAASDLKQEQATQRRKAELEQALQTLDAQLERDQLYDSRLGGDLKIFKNLVGQQLGKRPLDWSHVVEADALLKEMRVKADFIKKRNHEIATQRRKLSEYGDAMKEQLAIKPGTAARLLGDKTLKAGGHFTDFANALKDFEKNPADKAKAKLVKAVDSYLRHFDKFSDADKGKPENIKKFNEVMSVKDSLDAEALLEAAEELQVKDPSQWTREDQTRATEHYLGMMLLLSDAPPKNLKGEHASELVMRVNNVKDKPKLVVKPISNEIPVDGFVKGGGGGREMLANVMADKLQEMLGIELNAPLTKVVMVDGGKIGMKPGTKVACSAQAWSKAPNSLNELIDARFAKRDPKGKADGFSAEPEDMAAVLSTVPKEEVQSKAVFDLIALHCDRHPGNFMLGDDNKLVPIDHGNILPTRAGLVARKEYLGLGHAVLKKSPATQEKLSPELIERIERLNTKELMDTTKAAKGAMAKATPEADKGDLDEGLKNSQRSIEFLKAAASRLTLAQIYEAYYDSQHDIFFSDESRKAAGFERAISNKLGAQDAARAELKKLFPVKDKDQVDWAAIRNKAQALGWFKDLEPSEFSKWRQLNGDRLLRIVNENIRRPAPKARNVARPSKADAKFNGEAVDPATLQRYLELGGDDMFYEVWPAPEDPVFTQLHKRVYVMEGLVGVETL